MEVVAPKNARQGLWEKFFASIFPEHVDQFSAMDFGIIPRQPILRMLAERCDQGAILSSLRKDRGECEIIRFGCCTHGLLIGIDAAGNFERKWHANRMARSSILQLRIDLTDPSVSADEVRKKLRETVDKQNKGIVAAD